jgi:hypothetical protein
MALDHGQWLPFGKITLRMRENMDPLVFISSN